LRPSSYQLALIALAVLGGAGTVHSGVQTPSAPIYFTPPDEAQVPTALVRSVRVIPGQHGAAIEILATRPLTPAITIVNNPLRLVVDLPKSLVASRRRISFRDPQIRGVRVDQFHQNPPAVRLVVDLDKEASASWDAAGNRLMIRLHPGPTPGETSTSSAAFSQGTAPASSAGSGVSGTLISAGSRIAAGSAVTAGADTAILHMGTGGEVRVCPGTTVSVTSSQSGRDVMLGMNTGALEAHYRLDTSADSVLTPDFRILFAGPGEFHYAVSADSRGNTCVRTLPGNTASVVVSELMGDGVYQVRPSEQVVFRLGHLASIDAKVPEDCGCPGASVPVMRAGAAETNSVDGTPFEPQPGSPPVPVASRLPSGTEIAGLPAESPTDVHIQVDAPFIFRASDRLPGVPVLEARKLPLARLRPADSLQVVALPPPAADEKTSVAQNAHKGFFGKIGSLLGSLFR
jgi:hypothetical protein